MEWILCVCAKIGSAKRVGNLFLSFVDEEICAEVHRVKWKWFNKFVTFFMCEF